MQSFTCCFRDSKNSRRRDDGDQSSDVNEDVVETHSKNKNDQDFYEFLAPSVHHLQTSFMEYIVDNNFTADSTIYDVEDLSSSEPGLIRRKGLEMTCPIDGQKGCSYVHCLKEDDQVGTATHMLSYTWGYSVGDIINTLQIFCEKENLDPKRTYIWICCLCNNQHRIADTGYSITFEVFRSMFKKRVKGIGKLIAMMAPWNDPGYLKRIWCVFEMFTAYSEESCHVEILMPLEEKGNFVRAMKSGRDERGNWGIDSLLTVLANTKVENAQSSFESDKENILKLIQEGPGYGKLNQEVNQLMREWTRQSMFDAVDEAENNLSEGSNSLQVIGETCNLLFYVATYLNKMGQHKEAMDLYKRELEIIENAPEEDDDLKVRKATCFGTIGTGHFYLGDYESALAGFEKSRIMNEELFGLDHQRTATSIFNVGNVQLELSQLDNALESFIKCSSIYEAMYGEEHTYTADTYDYLGRVYEAKKDIEKALQMYKKALNIREKSRGHNHPDVATSLNSLALLYLGEDKYDQALATFDRSISIWESVYGTEHPETATSYFNKGLAYQAKREIDNALEYFMKSKMIREKFYGKDHPNTITVKDIIDSINS